jgi:hypothetical protein
MSAREIGPITPASAIGEDVVGWKEKPKGDRSW